MFKGRASQGGDEFLLTQDGVEYCKPHKYFIYYKVKFDLKISLVIEISRQDKFHGVLEIERNIKCLFK